MDTAELTRAFGAFFAIMNPFVNLPIFIGLTSGYSVKDQRSLAVKVVLFSAIMCGVILVCGSQIIGFFGITIDQFRIAGGIVLAKIAWDMLNGAPISSHHGSQNEQDHLSGLSALAFYPVTFPMIVGPGSIATLIVYAGHASSTVDLLGLAAVLAVVLAILFLALFFASVFSKVLSDTMRVIMTRLMRMILLAIAVEMLAAGQTAVMPGLARAG